MSERPWAGVARGGRVVMRWARTGASAAKESEAAVRRTPNRIPTGKCMLLLLTDSVVPWLYYSWFKAVNCRELVSEDGNNRRVHFIIIGQIEIVLIFPII